MAADPLRQAVIDLLEGNQAHVNVAGALELLRPEWRIHHPPGLHSVWQLLEHIRITQEDILRYTLDAAWRSPAWPEGYWPENPSNLSDAAWQASLAGYQSDLQELIALARDPERDLCAPLPHGEGRTYLRQLLLASDHTAYHTGQILSLRRALSDWPPEVRVERSRSDS